MPRKPARAQTEQLVAECYDALSLTPDEAKRLNVFITGHEALEPMTDSDVNLLLEILQMLLAQPDEERALTLASLLSADT